MQKCCNELALDIQRDLKKYPIAWIIIGALISITVVTLTFGFICNVNIYCGNTNTGLLITVGFSCLISIAIFIIIPIMIRCFINCIWYRQYIEQMYPHSLTGASRSPI